MERLRWCRHPIICCQGAMWGLLHLEKVLDSPEQLSIPFAFRNPYSASTIQHVSIPPSKYCKYNMQEHVFQKTPPEQRTQYPRQPPTTNNPTTNNHHHHHHNNNNNTHSDVPELKQNGFPLWFCNIAGLANCTGHSESEGTSLSSSYTYFPLNNGFCRQCLFQAHDPGKKKRLNETCWTRGLAVY